MLRQQWRWEDGGEIAEENEAAALFTLREGRIVRWRPFADRAEALGRPGSSPPRTVAELTAEPSLRPGADGRPRCWWAAASPEYVGYHDREWGRPVLDDRGLYERLCLEAFQAGLSWLTILRKREAFRAAFGAFEIAKVAAFGDADVKRLLADEGIVRNRAKIEATIENGRAALRLREAGESLSELIWSFRPSGRPPRVRARTSRRRPRSRPPLRASSSGAAFASSGRRPPTR